MHFWTYWFSNCPNPKNFLQNPTIVDLKTSSKVFVRHWTIACLFVPGFDLIWVCNNDRPILPRMSTMIEKWNVKTPIVLNLWHGIIWTMVQSDRHCNLIGKSRRRLVHCPSIDPKMPDEIPIVDSVQKAYVKGSVWEGEWEGKCERVYVRRCTIRVCSMTESILCCVVMSEHVW